MFVICVHKNFQLKVYYFLTNYIAMTHYENKKEKITENKKPDEEEVLQLKILL